MIVNYDRTAFIVQATGPFINLPILQPTVNFLRGQELGLLGKGLETRPGPNPIKLLQLYFTNLSLSSLFSLV